jgi:hypothetical protein
MTTPELRSIACRLAGIPLPAGRRLPNGVPIKLAAYLGCSVSHARHLLAGDRQPNPQAVRLLERIAK